MSMKPLSAASSDTLKSGQTAHNTIPGLFIQEDKNKKKKVEPKKKKVETGNLKFIKNNFLTYFLVNKNVILDIVEKLRKSVKEIKISEPSAPQPDPAKRLKNLKKRLREIEGLEVKIKNGEVKNLDKDQLDKVARKKEVVNEIKTLERSIQNNS